jgi:two-component system copper resistance phosphate regulon response regulator CusR
MRLLVVEDERKLGRFLKHGLEEEHYAVDLAYDGEEGWYLSQVNDYDLMILDVMMPKMDGLTLCRRIRAAQKLTPIILLTARDAVEDRVSGLDQGADDYLVKPFAFSELLARIRALLRRQRDSIAIELQVADLILNPARRRVTRTGVSIDLTAKEYALLEYLMRHSGEIVTRTQITEHVWDQQFDTDTNVIEVYISYLRQKIDPPHAAKLLHTVRGMGYVLQEDA